MNKKRRNFLDLSLLQQLATLISFIAVITLLFFTFYLRGNIKDFVTNQCMSLIERSQNTIIARVNSGYEGSYSELNYDADVIHFVYENDKLRSYYGNIIIENNFFIGVKNEVDANKDKEIIVENIWHFNGMNYYYRMNHIDDSTVIISLLDSSYGKSIENSLLSSVLNNTFLIFLFIFIILIFWVFTIITPLQQIRTYVDKIRKNDEEATLIITREDEIGEMANALVDMKKEIDQQTATKEEMVHNISHDLKTPIAIIKSYAESIRDGIYPYDTLEASVDVIIQNAERLEKKVHSLLFLNRIDYVMSEEKGTDKTTNMNVLLDDIIQSFKMIRPEVEVEKYTVQNVTFRGEDESWRVVVSNLMDNALRYAESKVVIDLQPYSITVYNDGEKLSSERIKKLFKPFEKGDKGNYGLGLSICYKVCNTYDYKIEAENMPNGVIFIITDRDQYNEKNSKENKKEVKREKGSKKGLQK